VFNGNVVDNPTTSFTPKFNPNSAPNADFSTSLGGGVVFYRGVNRVWIGDGSGTYEGNPDNGILYTETVDDKVVPLGPVTDYYYAVSQGYQGTFENWVTFLLETSGYAIEAHMWANGGETGTPSVVNNSKYYAEMAMSYAQEAVESAEQFTPITIEEIDALF